MIDPGQMSGGAPGGGGTPMMGSESLLALLAGAAIGQMGQTPGMMGAGGGDPSAQAQPGGGQQPQGPAKGDATAVGQSSMSAILPQLLQALVGQAPTTGAGGPPGKSAAQGAQLPQQPGAAQEPVALSVLRMLGMTRPSPGTQV